MSAGAAYAMVKASERNARNAARVAAHLAAHTETRGPGECWRWTGATDVFGGLHPMMVDGRLLPIRRAIWEREHGPIDENARVKSTCRNKSCVNPAHLRLAVAKYELDGVVQPLSAWCRAYGVPYHMVRERLLRGWPLRRALENPSRKNLRASEQRQELRA